MTKGDIVYIYFVVLTIVRLSTTQYNILEVSIPNSGSPTDRIKYYKNMLDLTQQKYNIIRFSVRANNDAILLFSERRAKAINVNTDSDFIEIVLGGGGNSKTFIRVGCFACTGSKLPRREIVSTPNILHSNIFRYVIA